MPADSPGPLQLRSATVAAAARRVRREPEHVWAHLGFGNFTRAHQFSYQHQLRAMQPDNGWRYVAVGVLVSDRAMRDVMARQDNVYVHVSWDDETSAARVIDVVDDFLWAPGDPEAVLRTLAAPQCGIVSMTITEGGYFVDPLTGAFEADHPDIVRERERAPGAPPSTWVGYVVDALARRRAGGLPPFTLVSCDNVQHNGQVAREAVLGLAGARDAHLRDWIATETAFPCTMVDRITPVTTDRHRTLLAAELGVEDGWPVFSEPYGEWHVEHFGGARPALELVGVDFADRATVEAHEQRKIRVLNGAHQAITYIGLLLGHTYCHEAIRDEDVAVFAARVMAEEIAPCVGPVPASDGSDEGVGAYAERTRARFANSRLEDTLERIGTDSWIRMTRFVVPSLLDQIRAGGPHQLLSFVVATWLRALAARPSVRRVVGGPVEPALREALAAGADAAALVHVAGLLPDALVASPAARTITDQLAELGAGDRQQARRALRDVLTRAAR